MPISRKKTCIQCRKAKTRCSLTLPRCTRCIDRGLSCEYGIAAAGRTAPYSVMDAHSGDAAVELRPLAATSRHGHAARYDQQRPERTVGGFPAGCVLIDLALDNMLPSSSPPISSAPPAMVAPAGSNRQETWPASLHVDLAAGAGVDVTGAMSMGPPIEPCHNVLSFINSVNMASHPTAGDTANGGGDDEETRLRNTIAGAQSDFIHDKASRVLTKSRSITANTILSTRAILGQVCSYPAMMVSGHALPPFIHSRCSLDDSITHDCARAQKHGCLRKTLSVCAALVSMWLEKTHVTTPFVWETIYNEVARMHKEHESFDSETMLESIQALTIYLLLQAQDTETLGKNDVKLLLIVVAEIGHKLHVSLEYNSFVDTLENPLNRTTWVLYESARRTLCLLYIVEMFLEVNFRHQEPRCCQSFAAAPLPCVRELWEVPSTYEWNKRYSTFLRGRAAEKILTLTDYKLSQHLSAEDLIEGSNIGEGGGGITKDVLRWCEGLDQFGTLVALVATLVKYELGPSILGTNGYAKIA